jgi:hypothetical protein
MFRKNYFLLVLHGFLALLIAGCAGTVIKKRTLERTLGTFVQSVPGSN